jgi:hypothetical protein
MISGHKRRTATHLPQMMLNADDDLFFRSFVIEGNHTVDVTTTSHELIKRAYDVVRADVRATANDAAGAWAERLYAWVEYLKDRVRVGLVEVPTEADAFLILRNTQRSGGSAGRASEPLEKVAA